MNHVLPLDSMTCQNDPSLNPRWWVIQCLRDKQTNFSVNGVNFQLTIRKGKAELGITSNRHVIRPLFTSTNVSDPLKELPGVIMEKMGWLAQEKETMLRYGFKPTQRHLGYIMPLSLTNGRQGWVKLEADHGARCGFYIKAMVSWGGVLDLDKYCSFDAPSFPRAAVSFVRDKLLSSVNANQFLDRLRLYTSMSSSFQEEMLKNEFSHHWSTME